MRLAERQKIAFDKAQVIVPPDVFAVLSAAMISGAPVKFTYTDRYRVTRKYTGEHPLSFFETPQDADWPGSVLLWSRHELHSKKEQYRVERILAAKRLITLMDALLDLSTNAEFWNGEEPEEKVISTFEQLLQDINKQTDIAGQNQVTLDWLRNNLPLSTAPIESPHTEFEHVGYKIYVKGVPLYFDVMNDAVIAAAREIMTDEAEPAALKAYRTAVQIVAEECLLDPEITALTENGFITIFKNTKIDTGFLAHEDAHDFAENKWGTPFPPVGSDYLAAVKSGEPPVSEYATLTTGEDFAEAVKMYVVDPAQLQKIASRRYKVIKRLMEDEKYGG